MTADLQFQGACPCQPCKTEVYAFLITPTQDDFRMGLLELAGIERTRITLFETRQNDEPESYKSEENKFQRPDPSMQPILGYWQ